MNSIRRGLRVRVQHFGEFFDQAHAVNFVAGRGGCGADATMEIVCTNTTHETRMPLSKAQKSGPGARAAMQWILPRTCVTRCDHADHLRGHADAASAAGPVAPARRAEKAAQNVDRRHVAKVRGHGRRRSCHHAEVEVEASAPQSAESPCHGARRRADFRTAGGRGHDAAQSGAQGREVRRISNLHANCRTAAAAAVRQIDAPSCPLGRGPGASAHPAGRPAVSGNLHRHAVRQKLRAGQKTADHDLPNEVGNRPAHCHAALEVGGNDPGGLHAPAPGGLHAAGSSHHDCPAAHHVVVLHVVTLRVVVLRAVVLHVVALRAGTRHVAVRRAAARHLAGHPWADGESHRAAAVRRRAGLPCQGGAVAQDGMHCHPAARRGAADSAAQGREEVGPSEEPPPVAEAGLRAWHPELAMARR